MRDRSSQGSPVVAAAQFIPEVSTLATRRRPGVRYMWCFHSPVFVHVMFLPFTRVYFNVRLTQATTCMPCISSHLPSHLAQFAVLNPYIVPLMCKMWV